MMKSCMHGSGINKMRKCHLMDATQALIVRMRNDLQQQGMVYGDETIDRIVDYFARFISPACGIYLLKHFKTIGKFSNAAQIN